MNRLGLKVCLLIYNLTNKHTHGQHSNQHGNTIYRKKTNVNTSFSEMKIKWQKKRIKLTTFTVVVSKIRHYKQVANPNKTVNLGLFLMLSEVSPCSFTQCQHLPSITHQQLTIIQVSASSLIRSFRLQWI